MISSEPKITVGILEHRTEVHGVFNGTFVAGGTPVTGKFSARVESGTIVLFKHVGRSGASPYNLEHKAIANAKEIRCVHTEGATFTLHDVTIGISFHWERKESQTFQGNLVLVLRDDLPSPKQSSGFAQAGGTITAINEISVEEYLASVISSEMSAEAPPELLKAHAITSRSWLVAMLEREKKAKNKPAIPRHTIESATELIRWHDREDHDLFDVCADDHCQRYQGITKIISKSADDAIEETRGKFILYADEICDARFYKSCGGLSEEFQNTWEDVHVPYLTCVADSSTHHQHIKTEQDAEQWILFSPDAYCNTTDVHILRQILPSFDQETTDFFRWKVEYTRGELSEIVLTKSGIDFGEIKNLVPVQRGPSGRLIKLRIEGSKKTLVIGKELGIRRWLSKSHLYSSAFIVRKEADKFILIGAGWGHGVGLCQIGAAVMAAKGFKAEEIVKHYFHGVELKKLY
ncbi:MAG: SpoIID/LytB domain-containing protein [Bacteroidota bacterium]|nr:SpoIID/LytB domain-containing protein [Bacteroidota bacterium]